MILRDPSAYSLALRLESTTVHDVVMVVIFSPLFQTLFNRIHHTHLISETLKLTGIALTPYTQARGTSVCI